MSLHALLSPSSAHRWLNCTPSAHLEEKEADKESSYALEGTLAHAICARKLKEYLGLADDEEREEIARLAAAYYTDEMEELTDAYVSIVKGKLDAARAVTPDARLLVEVRLNFHPYVPESFGTADAVVIADGRMEVIDFKYGKGVRVSAFENPQMMIYGLGALDAYSAEYYIRSVRMTIVQPRLENLSEWETDAEGLVKWGVDTLAPAARRAFRGEGAQRPGLWCRFCKVNSRCRALFELGKGSAESDARLLSDRELSEEVLPLLPAIKSWVSDVEDYALHRALDGAELPGWKVVEGRSIRRIPDTEGAASVLRAAGLSAEEVYRPRELRTLTELERKLGKKRFSELLGPLVEKPKGKPTLAAAGDPRPAIDPVADDFKNIP
ncbi:MAG: DUF2800 domain-containing protein [Muribaculaceae bacterium]